jgi:hypothetical protein
MREDRHGQPPQPETVKILARHEGLVVIGTTVDNSLPSRFGRGRSSIVAASGVEHLGSSRGLITDDQPRTAEELPRDEHRARPPPATTP